MQYEITKHQTLFNDKGCLHMTGWAKKLVLQYDRDDSKAFRFQMRERDGYYIYNDRCALHLSVGNYGKKGVVSASIADFEKGTIHSCYIKKSLPKGKLRMSLSSDNGDVTYTDSRVGIKFSKASDARFIKCEFINFYDGKTLYVNLKLADNTVDSIVNVIPFENSKSSFLYKQFVPAMTVSGVVRCGGDDYYFDDSNSFAVLNWSRCALPKCKEHFSINASGMYHSNSFALNLCNGIGDEKRGSQNAVFVNGKIVKLGFVKIEHSKTSALLEKPWYITDDEGKLDMVFTPIITTHTNSAMAVKIDDRIIVYGTMAGNIFDNDKLNISLNDFPACLEITRFV